MKDRAQYVEDLYNDLQANNYVEVRSFTSAHEMITYTTYMCEHKRIMTPDSFMFDDSLKGFTNALYHTQELG